MKDFKFIKNKILQDKEIKKDYDKLKPQYSTMEMIIKRRLKIKADLLRCYGVFERVRF